jgi:hypothetical protein
MGTRDWKEPKDHTALEDNSLTEDVEVEEDGVSSNVEEKGKSSPQMRVVRM